MYIVTGKNRPNWPTCVGFIEVFDLKPAVVASVVKY